MHPIRMKISDDREIITYFRGSLVSMPRSTLTLRNRGFTSTDMPENVWHFKKSEVLLVRYGMTHIRLRSTLPLLLCSPERNYPCDAPIRLYRPRHQQIYGKYCDIQRNFRYPRFLLSELLVALIRHIQPYK